MKKIQNSLQKLLFITALLPIAQLTAAARSHGEHGLPTVSTKSTLEGLLTRPDNGWKGYLHHHQGEGKRALAYLTNYYEAHNDDVREFYAVRTFELLHEFPQIDVNFFIDETGDTPLTRACAHGRIMIINKLLDHGANPEVKSQKDDSPIDLLRGAYNHKGKSDWERARRKTILRMQRIIDGE